MNAAIKDDNKDLGMFAALLPASVPVRPAANDEPASDDVHNHRIHHAPNMPASESMSRDRALTFNTIGPRLVAARELNGIPQQEAARLAGMGNSTQLSLWEMGRRAPTLDGLLAVANTLGVSMDFIFGLSDDPERDARSARRNSCIRAVNSMLTKTAERIADFIDSSDSLAGPDAANFRELLTAASELSAAAEQYHRLNREQFETSPGSATLLAATERMDRVRLKARATLRGHDAFAESMRLQISTISRIDEHR